LEEVMLPGASESFCGIHLGAMDSIAAGWQAIHQEVVARGFTPAGPIRQIYLPSGPAPQQDWLTELQQPVVPACRPAPTGPAREPLRITALRPYRWAPADHRARPP